MKQSKRTLLILPILGWSFVSLLCPALDRAQSPDRVIVTGTVLDSDSMAPLPGVDVSWRSQRGKSDNAGHYQMELPAGVREIFFSAFNSPVVKKVLVVREPGSRVRQDVLLSRWPGATKKALAMDRGSRVGQHGKDLDSDISANSPISLADEYGNQDQFLTLNVGKNRVHSPVWLNSMAIAYGKEGALHNPENSRLLGVFQFQISPTRVQQIAPATDVQFLSKSPRKDALAVASHKEIYVLESLSDPGSLRRIFSLEPNKGFLLSIAWAPDDRLYFTVDDSVQLDDRHYLSRSRIASIKTDGTDLKPDWASDPQYSYRYPTPAAGAGLIFCRFALDGGQQTLFSRDFRTGETKQVAEPALRAVHIDAGAGRLYYIYRQDLHLRNLKSGADWVIVNSVKEADYLSPTSQSPPSPK